MFRAIFISVVCCTIAGGCSPCLPLATTSRDSTVVEIRPRLVTIRDTVWLEVPHTLEREVVKCDSSMLANQYAQSEAIILSDGSLRHTLESIAQSVEHPVEYDVVLRDSVVYRDRVLVERVELPRDLSEWQKIQIYGFWILLLILLLILRLG